MGLHPDIKSFLKEEFSECFSKDVPAEHLDCQICDLMFVLYNYTPDEESTLDSLVDFIWAPVRQFYENGGVAFVGCFDDSRHVPSAKREEQRKRREKVAEAVTVRSGLPWPWRPGLADAAVRAELMRNCVAGLQRRFAREKFRSKTLTLQVDSRPSRSTADASGALSVEELETQPVGEADVAVPRWIKEYAARPVVVRVLDSDHIVIALLTAHITRRSAPLYVWLRARGMSARGALCNEPRDVLDVRSLVAVLQARNMPPADLSFFIVCQQTDFVRKVVTNLGVKKILTHLLFAYRAKKKVQPLLHLSEAEQTADLRRAFLVLRGAVEAAPRAGLVTDVHGELARAWWNVLYWCSLSAPPPCERYGWDPAGKRRKVTEVPGAVASGKARN